MSLKAKIEAVIYASEEPVTLVQLVGLLGVEAQAELDERESQQQSLALSDADSVSPSEDQDDQDALNAETLDRTDEDEDGGEAESVTDTEAATTEADSAPPLEPTSAEVSEAVAVIAEEIAEHADAALHAAQPSDAATEPPPQLAAPTLDGKARERRLREYFRSILDQLITEYAKGDRGLEIREVAGGFRLSTKPEYHDAVRGFVKSLKPPLKLSLQALEALAVVAYKQPVTAPEVSEIRGVESGGVLGSLMTRKLITTAGRKQVIGRPILYKTTKDFLVRFGLKDINELPSIEEFERMAGEFADSEPVQEEIEMGNRNNTSEEAVASGDSAPVDEIDSAPTPTNALHESVEEMMSDKSTSPEGSGVEDVEPMKGEHEPQADGDDRPIDDTDNIVVDGRISGIPPRNDDSDNPSAREAEIQSTEEKGNS